jgi:hypothetical protein
VIEPGEAERCRVGLDDVDETLPWDRILNADESFWLVLYLARKRIAPTGVEIAKLKADNDQQAGLTPMGTITVAGMNFPLFLVAKRLIRRCHKQFEDVVDQSDVYITHSRSGWVTQPGFNECLACPWGQTPYEPLCLALNQY